MRWLARRALPILLAVIATAITALVLHVVLPGPQYAAGTSAAADCAVAPPGY
jgi:hypothetical protein